MLLGWEERWTPTLSHNEMGTEVGTYIVSMKDGNRGGHMQKLSISAFPHILYYSKIPAQCTKEL